MTNYSGGSEDCSAWTCWALKCGDQRHVGEREQPPTSQRKPASQGRQLFCDDVIVFDLILQSINVFNPHNHAKHFCR